MASFSRLRGIRARRIGGLDAAAPGMWPELSEVRHEPPAIRRYDRGVKIDRAEVRRVATLASLDLDEDEVGRMAEELSAILTYMEMLNRLDTSLVEPTFHSVAHEAPFREDVARPGLGAEEAARGAPALAGRPRGGQFLVPRVIG